MRWRDVRAGLIAVAIVLALVDGLPIPPLGEADPWQRPIVEAVQPLQRGFLRPFAWITRDLRFTQRWALFQSASPSRFRMAVDGRDHAGAWRALYRAGDPSASEDAELLEYRRIRGAWNPTVRTMGQYPAFVDWLAARLLATHPDLVAIRVRMERVALSGGTLTGTGTYLFELHRGRP
ncbi:MAG: hypothetical protein KF773_21055 [Deltaproteobacteria bacterium]|nr:hypothetical protein [Deltaproteobacteria bacterium]